MSEKRRPEIVLLATVRGKRSKVELYRGALWPKKFPYPSQQGRFRVRINGTWRGGDNVYTVTEVFSQLRGWVTGKIRWG